MIPFLFDYATPSVFESDRERSLVGISANRRRPVRFHGRVEQQAFLLRVAMRAFGEAIWSNDSWESAGGILDPIITVHPDRLFLEAFSQDQSVYALLILDPGLFKTEGETRSGTTNIDFTAWLWAALAQIRTSRETWFRVGCEGFEVKTSGFGGRFERKVDVPPAWIRGFLNLQAAMGLPGTRLSARAVDVLSAIRFMRYTKAKVSPRALRYEFLPGADVKMVLEPWEHEVVLKGTSHAYVEPKTIRTWGRRRLSLIEGLLPFAQQVDIYLKGRALPSFYAVKLEGMTFVLGLSGWTENRWTHQDGFALLTGETANPLDVLPQVRQLLKERCHADVKTLADALGQPAEMITQALIQLCRQGMAIFDVERREYRHRELFETPIDERLVFPPSERLEKARTLVKGGDVKGIAAGIQETRKIKHHKTPLGKSTREVVYRDWHVTGGVGQETTEIVVKDNVTIIFGTCSCAFFQENLLNQGPCAEMLALFMASAETRKDLPVSADGEGVIVVAPPKKQGAAASPTSTGDEATEDSKEGLDPEGEP